MTEQTQTGLSMMKGQYSIYNDLQPMFYKRGNEMSDMHMEIFQLKADLRKAHERIAELENQQGTLFEQPQRGGDTKIQPYEATAGTIHLLNVLATDFLKSDQINSIGKVDHNS